ncbi:P-loop containing nucleoside triphosphate hydrolase protein [Melampsora americana]|nr:P-loop containing nucleoside triphosphate hydrolase protein [Melampsora americana]
MSEAKRCLTEVWGFDEFRGVQEAVIRRLLCEGLGATVVMPTGGGKSLLYQLPALLLPGLTIVISPLLALMKDQVDGLVKRGVPAASLDSMQDMQQAAAVKAEVRSGKIKLLYVAPERLNNELFLDMMNGLECISMVAVDEAHCISEWGPSFRPDYLKVARFAQEVNAQRVLALTATATPQVAKEICAGFSIDYETGLFKTSTYRSNLTLKVEVATTPEEKLSILIPMLESRTGSAIVYVTTQGDAEDLVQELRRRGLEEASVYHAGMSSEDRLQTQEKFIQSERGIVCSTIAFGMGIDKASIRQVIHYKLPKTLENYSQEIGRAGRDGLPSECCVFLSKFDIPPLEAFARGNTPSLRSMKSWLMDVFTAELDEDECLVFNHFEQAKTHDIKTNTLGLLFAQLELNFGLLRATTPFYGVFTWPRNDRTIARMKAEKGDIARTLCDHMKTGPVNSSIDIREAASLSGIRRAELTAHLNRWQTMFDFQTKGTQVRHRYRLSTQNGAMPGIEMVDAIATQLYDEMFKREEADVGRLYEVVDLLTKDDCIAQSLAAYFGDYESIPLSSCGACTYCATLEPIKFDFKVETKVDAVKAKLILDACPYRDDARLLARIALGIGSPRTTELKLTKASEGGPFGCMEDTQFDQLITYFEKECKKVKYINKPVAKTFTKPSGSKPSARPSTKASGSKSSGKYSGSSTAAKRMRMV